MMFGERGIIMEETTDFGGENTSIIVNLERTKLTTNDC